MSPAISGLVQTSNNLARVLVRDGEFTILCLTRRLVDSEKIDLAKTICYNFELDAAKPSFGGYYPGWAPKPDAHIAKLMSDLYEERYHEKPKVNAIHTGLECGILGTNYPALEMISYGQIFVAQTPPMKKYR